jgi:hypothetical protein
MNHLATFTTALLAVLPVFPKLDCCVRLDVTNDKATSVTVNHYNPDTQVGS